MRVFLDTEFYNDGHSIELISIGLVAADGRELYLLCLDWAPVRADGFIRDRVLPLLPPRTDPRWRARDEIAYAVRAFIGESATVDPLELWGDCCAFDYVVLSQLFGTFAQWPAGWPYYINDVQQLAHHLGIDLKRVLGTPPMEHHSLVDARHVHAQWEYLQP